MRDEDGVRFRTPHSALRTRMIPVVVVGIYLVIIAVIGSVAFRKGKANTEDFFLASRAIGPMVFFLSIFATNMIRINFLAIFSYLLHLVCLASISRRIIFSNCLIINDFCY